MKKYNCLADILAIADQTEINQHIIPTTVKQAAKKGLLLRKKFGRGGTEVGLNRANQLINDKSVSDKVIKQMYAFFKRHEIDKQGKNWYNKKTPSNGYIANLLWGGDAGQKWSYKERIKIK